MITVTIVLYLIDFKRLITFTSDYIKRLSLYLNEQVCQKYRHSRIFEFFKTPPANSKKNVIFITYFHPSFPTFWPVKYISADKQKFVYILMFGTWREGLAGKWKWTGTWGLTWMQSRVRYSKYLENFQRNLMFSSSLY